MVSVFVLYNIYKAAFTANWYFCDLLLSHQLYKVVHKVKTTSRGFDKVLFLNPNLRTAPLVCCTWLRWQATNIQSRRLNSYNSSKMQTFQPSTHCPIPNQLESDTHCICDQLESQTSIMLYKNYRRKRKWNHPWYLISSKQRIHN